METDLKEKPQSNETEAVTEKKDNVSQGSAHFLKDIREQSTVTKFTHPCLHLFGTGKQVSEVVAARIVPRR